MIKSHLLKYQKKEVIEFKNEVPEKPKVSVSVITYQHVNFIRQCLDGILMQITNFPYEILLGEDGSTDGTRELCLEYAKKYPKKIRLFLHHRENVIYFKNRPTGRFNSLYNLYIAKGNYIAICEGDDYWTDPHKLQEQVDFLEKNPKYVLIGGTSAQIFESENFKIIHHTNSYYKNFDVNIEYLFQKNPFKTLTVLFRNHLIKEFPEIFLKNTGGDRRLYLLICQYGKGRYVNKEYGVYRIHQGGTSFNQRQSISEAIKRSIWKIKVNKKWNNYFDKKYTKIVKKTNQNIRKNILVKFYYAPIEIKLILLIRIIYILSVFVINHCFIKVKYYFFSLIKNGKTLINNFYHKPA
jgi:glycosyltransferase involved in cell wall biosynthesis